MKKYYIILLITMFSCSLLYAQLPNGNFNAATCTGNGAFATCVPNWIQSHGSPSINSSTNPYAWMWSYSARGEGILANFNFQQGVTYSITCRIRTRDYNIQTIRDNALLNIMAANGIVSQTSSSPIPTPTSSQNIISNLFNNYTNLVWTNITTTFTADANYSQFWVHPRMNLPAQPDGNGNTRQSELSIDDITITVVSPPCDDCYSFQPKPGQEYIVSGWVKEEHATQVMSYSSSYIRVNFYNQQGNIIQSTDFNPVGHIIDSWQRIADTFIIPGNATDIEVELRNDNQNIVSYFDDIRVHPFNSNMKTYVYDPQTQWLMAEQDENNYSTFYEYDNQGGLVRIKKETEKGIYTVQETRSSHTKNN